MVIKYEVVVYEMTNGKQPFADWVTRLDKTMRARIYARINRLEQGHLGDAKSLKDGLFELRCFFGPGYRVYFAISEDLVVLLCGGAKDSQDSDIGFAKKYWKDWKETK